MTNYNNLNYNKPKKYNKNKKGGNEPKKLYKLLFEKPGDSTIIDLTRKIKINTSSKGKLETEQLVQSELSKFKNTFLSKYKILKNPIFIFRTSYNVPTTPSSASTGTSSSSKNKSKKYILVVQDSKKSQFITESDKPFKFKINKEIEERELKLLENKKKINSSPLSSSSPSSLSPSSPSSSVLVLTTQNKNLTNITSKFKVPEEGIANTNSGNHCFMISGFHVLFPLFWNISNKESFLQETITNTNTSYLGVFLKKFLTGENIPKGFLTKIVEEMIDLNLSGTVTNQQTIGEFKNKQCDSSEFIKYFLSSFSDVYKHIEDLIKVEKSYAYFYSTKTKPTNKLKLIKSNGSTHKINQLGGAINGLNFNQLSNSSRGHLLGKIINEAIKASSSNISSVDDGEITKLINLLDYEDIDNLLETNVNDAKLTIILNKMKSESFKYKNSSSGDETLSSGNSSKDTEMKTFLTEISKELKKYKTGNLKNINSGHTIEKKFPITIQFIKYESVKKNTNIGDEEFYKKIKKPNITFAIGARGNFSEDRNPEESRKLLEKKISNIFSTSDYNNQLIFDSSSISDAEVKNVISNSKQTLKNFGSTDTPPTPSKTTLNAGSVIYRTLKTNTNKITYNSTKETIVDGIYFTKGINFYQAPFTKTLGYNTSKQNYIFSKMKDLVKEYYRKILEDFIKNKKSTTLYLDIIPGIPYLFGSDVAKKLNEVRDWLFEVLNETYDKIRKGTLKTRKFEIILNCEQKEAKESEIKKWFENLPLLEKIKITSSNINNEFQKQYPWLIIKDTTDSFNTLPSIDSVKDIKEWFISLSNKTSITSGSTLKTEVNGTRSKLKILNGQENNIYHQIIRASYGQVEAWFRNLSKEKKKEIDSSSKLKTEFESKNNPFQIDNGDIVNFYNKIKSSYSDENILTFAVEDKSMSIQDLFIKYLDFDELEPSTTFKNITAISNLEKYYRKIILTKTSKFILIKLNTLIHGSLSPTKPISFKLNNNLSDEIKINVYDKGAINTNKPSNTSTEKTYILHDLIVHSGSASGGHYKCLSRRDNKWYVFDNASRTEYTETNLVKIQEGGFMPYFMLLELKP